MTVNDIIANIVKVEGGFVNDGDDRGGPTKYGITQRTLSAWRGGTVSVQAVEALTVAEASEIYRRRYVEDPGFAGVQNPLIRAFLCDSGVHHGPRRPTRWLQRLLAVKADGSCGKKTRHAINSLGEFAQLTVYLKLVAFRVKLMGRIITADWRKGGNQAKYAAGWLKRAVSFLEGFSC